MMPLMKRGCLLFLVAFALWAQRAPRPQPGEKQTRGVEPELQQPSSEPGNVFQDRGARWALVVGISSYQYLQPAAQLRFANRDAEQFADFLRSAAGGALPSDHIRLLTDGKATLAALRAALHTWLVEAARPEDIVYLFLAGHGVVAERDEAYIVAHDSDPQNLHATALSFREVDATLSTRLRAGLVVLAADVCHAGRLGWTSYAPDAANPVGEPLAQIGQGDRSFLKLLATRPSEQSFEDVKWNGGHGVFTYALLDGLGGGADRDGDGAIRASEVIDYIARIVPEQTKALQHPRVAGTFDASVMLARTPPVPKAPAKAAVTLDVSGPPGSDVYIDDGYRGKVRPSGSLHVEALQTGSHKFSADFPDGSTLDGTITLRSAASTVRIAPPATDDLAMLRARIEAGRVVDKDGAWDFYRSHAFPARQQAAAASLIGGALEEVGQACVQDYVQSTDVGPKRAMLRRAVDAYGHLEELRPGDAGIETRRLFCLGRAQIAEGQFVDAVKSLQGAMRLDPEFACAYNALGVALDRLNRPTDARRAFDVASKLTPEWALPPFQIASQMIARGDLKPALPLLEQSVRDNPRSVRARWNLVHLDRLLKRLPDVERESAELFQLDPNYAPAYFELGEAYTVAKRYAEAAQAYDTYVLLAPNFADTQEARTRADRARAQAGRR